MNKNLPQHKTNTGWEKCCPSWESRSRIEYKALFWDADYHCTNQNYRNDHSIKIDLHERTRMDGSHARIRWIGWWWNMCVWSGVRTIKQQLAGKFRPLSKLIRYLRMTAKMTDGSIAIDFIESSLQISLIFKLYYQTINTIDHQLQLMKWSDDKQQFFLKMNLIISIVIINTQITCCKQCPIKKLIKNTIEYSKKVRIWRSGQN